MNSNSLLISSKPIMLEKDTSFAFSLFCFLVSEEDFSMRKKTKSKMVVKRETKKLETDSDRNT